MTKVLARTEIHASIQEVLNFLVDPRNSELVWPKEFSLKLLWGPERLQDGSEFGFQTVLLGQKFTWKSKIMSFTPPEQFTNMAIESPFKKWVHQHRLKHLAGVTIMEDEIEFATSLGPLGDLAAKRMVLRAIEYRSTSFRKLFGEPVKPLYRDALRMGLFQGTILSTLAITFSALLILNMPFGNGLYVLIIGLVSWVLLWLFTHDLAHFIVGLLAGVRFSHYYVGLSNVVRLKGLVPNSLKLAAIVLGLKIHRSKSKAGNVGFAAMFVAGALASMLSPFLVPMVILLRDASSIAGFILLAVSLVNFSFTLWFSPKVGCIYKARRELRKV